eukprot:TRINITY_DN5431_c0_g1_i1.p1 TRINITY_DN5431_c0_g1~~TRINITY_DN5431_c0_g1_i1.p1  ORF type:complete len:1014 (-),score=170.14 TRINITY_DN5431_c0_g1_i1:110-3151(-)
MRAAALVALAVYAIGVAVADTTLAPQAQFAQLPCAQMNASELAYTAQCCSDCVQVVGSFMDSATIFYAPALPYKFTEICVGLGIDASQYDPSLTYDITVEVRLYEDKRGIPAATPYASKSVLAKDVPVSGKFYTIDVSDAGFVTWRWVTWVGVYFQTCSQPVMGLIAFENQPLDGFYHQYENPTWLPLYPSFDPDGTLTVFFRQTGAVASLSAVGAPPGWTCNISQWNDGRICNCFCGVQDPDCTDTSLPIANCPAGNFVCSDKSNCLSVDDTCDPSKFGAFDGCDCDNGCGEADPDCRFQVSQAVLGCKFSQMKCKDNTCYIPFWTCEESNYKDGQKCNCGCGAVDPDCNNASLPIVGCMMDDAQCLQGGCVAKGWVCSAAFYSAKDGCDCATCGVVDPDCAYEEQYAYSCMEGQQCSANNTCVESGSCGNWRREGTEECDGGIGCSSNCSCLSGYLPSGTDALAVNCTNVCGDGRLVFPEECDGGFLCANCKCPTGFVPYDPPLASCGPACGNAILDDGEECDGGDGCNSQCKCSKNYKKDGSVRCRKTWVGLYIGVLIGVPGMLIIIAGFAALLFVIRHFHKQVKILSAPLSSRELMNTPAAEAIKTLKKIKTKGKLPTKYVLALDHIINLIVSDRLHAAEYGEKRKAGIAGTDIEVDAFLMENLVDVTTNIVPSNRPKTAALSHHSNYIITVQTDTGNASYDPMLKDWNYNIFAQNEENVLPIVAVGAFIHHNMFNEFDIDPAKFQEWVWLVNGCYNNNPYHNAVHAADVVQGMSVCLLNLAGTVPPLCKLAALFAAIIHDIAHPGVSNNFLYRTLNRLALLYNGISILENMHANMGFEKLLNEKNFLEHFEKDDLIEFHQMVTQLVLATDMAKHVEILSHLSTRAAANPLDFSSKTDMLLAMQGILKLCDLGNPLRLWEVCHKWSECIMEEFFQQGDLEVQHKLPKSPFMDRTTPKVAKCQCAFLEYAVAPLVAVVVPNIIPALGEVMNANMNENIVKWRSLADAEDH